MTQIFGFLPEEDLEILKKSKEFNKDFELFFRKIPLGMVFLLIYVNRLGMEEERFMFKTKKFEEFLENKNLKLKFAFANELKSSSPIFMSKSLNK